MARTYKKTASLLLLMNILLVGTVKAETKKPQSSETSYGGKWNGYFVVSRKFIERSGFMGFSSKDVEDTKKIYFQLALANDGEKIEGMMTEPNYGEDQAKNPTRRAIVKGKITDKKMVFTKTYDSIPIIAEFEGTLTSNLRSVSGKYKSSDLTGSFSMDKLSR